MDAGMIEKHDFYIDGGWTAPLDGIPCDVIDPSTEDVCARISLGGAADVDRAVAAARAALPGWRATPPAERLAALERLIAAYAARQDEMAEAISLEMGAPIDMSRAQQAPSGLDNLQDALDVARGYAWERPLGPQAPGTRILMEPIGVVGMITPWNWPMNQIALKVGPALAAGCTMVLKPSEVAPLSGLLFAEMVEAAGIPPGVFNLVNGDGAGVGTLMSGHPGIDMISFTGSTRAGILISKNAADTLKHVHLELGGKGANLIFADADDKAVKRGVLHCFNNTGQSCNAPTRMFVERSRYGQAVEEATALAQKMQVGPASAAGRHMGPVVSEVQYGRVQALIEKGIAEGARLTAGGPGRPDGFNRGFFVRPTIFADVTNDMTIAQEEIFGPVLSILPFEGEEDAVAMANDTRYGLTNYVQSQDPERRKRLARVLNSGMVEMNGVSMGPASPFGGVKHSGIGREGGVWGMEAFLQVKAASDWPG
jgi:aldehyde dehydrogenase (NAD+)